jgi:hypothetical protein
MVPFLRPSDNVVVLFLTCPLSFSGKIVDSAPAFCARRTDLSQPIVPSLSVFAHAELALA